MSRNLANGSACRICSAEVHITGERRTVTEADIGRYFEEYRGMVVADATCPDCDAKYLAWVIAPANKQWGHFANTSGAPFFDLSFRHSFNDEPAAEDLPTPKKLQELHDKARRAQADSLRERARQMRSAADEIDHAADALAFTASTSHWENYRR